MERAAIIDQFVLETGYPERGTTGRDRIRGALDHALRELWRDLPRTLTREEVRFELELPYSGGTLDIHTTDNHVFVIDGQPSASIPNDGRLSARWLEVLRAGQYIRRRVREVFVGAIYKGSARDYIVIDEPWDNLTDTGLTYRLWTDEYPYPADAQDISDVYLNPETGGELPLAICSSQLDYERFFDGQRATGRPFACSRGQFFQLPAPHYTPGVSIQSQPTNAQKWGWDSTGVERGSAFTTGLQFGAAGTFKYRVCHGWGRRRWLHPTKGWGYLMPFYLSAPSPASAAVTPTWGTGHVIVTSPDIDYVYGFGGDPTLPSKNRSGLEKWWFRARTATQAAGDAGNNAAEKQIEADSVYYLWAITDGADDSSNDKGQFDPVDRWYPLKDHHGHQHLKFNRISSNREHVRMVVNRRADTLRFDSDAPSLPVECLRPLFAKAEQFLAKRAGDVKRRQECEREYVEALQALWANQSLAGRLEQSSYGPGLPTTRATRRAYGRLYTGTISG